MTTGAIDKRAWEAPCAMCVRINNGYWIHFNWFESKQRKIARVVFSRIAHHCRTCTVQFELEVRMPRNSVNCWPQKSWTHGIWFKLKWVELDRVCFVSMALLQLTGNSCFRLRNSRWKQKQECVVRTLWIIEQIDHDRRVDNFAIYFVRTIQCQILKTLNVASK